jgi:hypothetical protein
MMQWMRRKYNLCHCEEERRGNLVANAYSICIATRLPRYRSQLTKFKES